MKAYKVCPNTTLDLHDIIKIGIPVDDIISLIDEESVISQGNFLGIRNNDRRALLFIDAPKGIELSKMIVYHFGDVRNLNSAESDYYLLDAREGSDIRIVWHTKENGQTIQYMIGLRIVNDGALEVGRNKMPIED